jgi:group I intron endonuclease
MDRSAIKKAYKEAKRPMGIYRILNTQNHKVYVGSSVDLSARINRHKAQLKLKSHRNRELQETWNLFGESAFSFEILDVLDQKENSQTNLSEELNVLLQMWVSKLEKEGYSIVSL